MSALNRTDKQKLFSSFQVAHSNTAQFAAATTESQQESSSLHGAWCLDPLTDAHAHALYVQEFQTPFFISFIGKESASCALTAGKWEENSLEKVPIRAPIARKKLRPNKSPPRNEKMYRRWPEVDLDRRNYLQEREPEACLKSRQDERERERVLGDRFKAHSFLSGLRIATRPEADHVFQTVSYSDLHVRSPPAHLEIGAPRDADTQRERERDSNSAVLVQPAAPAGRRHFSHFPTQVRKVSESAGKWDWRGSPQAEKERGGRLESARQIVGVCRDVVTTSNVVVGTTGRASSPLVRFYLRSRNHTPGHRLNQSLTAVLIVFPTSQLLYDVNTLRVQHGDKTKGSTSCHPPSSREL